MNAIILRHPATIKAEIKALASLAHAQSRISVQWMNWAREALAQGKPELARRYTAEAARKRVEAGWHLGKAMERKDASYAQF